MHQTGPAPARTDHPRRAGAQAASGPAAGPAAGPPAATELVLGLDVGGTSTRALLCDLSGNRYGQAVSGGGNPAAHNTHRAAAALTMALRGALAAADPGRVGHGVIGLAGRRLAADRPEVRAALRRAWAEAGLECPMTVVTDASVAFAAGSATGSGSVLVAGTGAIAVRLERWEEVRRADGLGWLLGDLGSGFWMGREAVRLTLEALAGRAYAPRLAPMVLAELLGAPTEADTVGEADPGGELTARLVAGVYGDSPVALARLAPLVTAAAEQEDPAAAGVVEAAAGHLLATLAAVRRPAERTPVVLAGSCLVTDNALARQVVRAVGRQWPGAELALALDGAAGAAVLAADSLGVDEATLASMHRRLLDVRG
jgi:N-acetylglucosamine kinase-like BadF-type ATPase